MSKQIPNRNSEIEVTREEVIQHGIRIFQSIGATHICDVCIRTGNSCCFACAHLKDESGCQCRNTACTAWLCGLQKFLFDQVGLLNEWESFWEQVPGQLFRKDRTPVKFKMSVSLSSENLDDEAGKLIANYLDSYVKQGGDLGELERFLDKMYTLQKLEELEQKREED
ncbi:hypothetical protein ACFDTO_30460 [Microbacteriaceae bacterium 4G12]